MALSRIEREEEVDNPIEGTLDEVKNSLHFPEAEKQVAYIEEEWKGALPEGEKGFLYMHYTNVIHLNSGEEVK